MARHSRIDVHSHFISPEYRQHCHDYGHAKPDGMPAIPPWTEDHHLQLMQQANISKSILSISSPGTNLQDGNDELALAVTRQCNDFAAELKIRRPNQFGFWASLPLPNVEATLQEIARAADELNADGFTMHTNHHGTYLGAKDLDPVFDEINRRKGIIFIHPTSPCLASKVKATPPAQFPSPMFEFFFDTARAVINLFLSGTVSRCPNIRFVIPHAGGALLPMIRRFSSMGQQLKLPGIDTSVTADWVSKKLNTQFYFDLAGWPVPEQIKGLLAHVSLDRILYGSDFPFTPMPVVLGMVDDLERCLPEDVESEQDQEAIYVLNATRLLAARSITSSAVQHDQ